MNTSFSSLLLSVRFLLWFRTTPAFENNLSTGTELQGMENNCRANLDSFVSFHSDQKVMGSTSIQG